MVLKVNPNRMELLKLRKRRDVAKRGHKLLKDKLDELMRHFLILIEKSSDLRGKVEQELQDAYNLFIIAKLEASTEVLEEALIYPKLKTKIEVVRENLLNVTIPRFKLDQKGALDCYSLGTTPAILDDALTKLNQILPLIIELAEAEKKIELLAAEIERTRQRVNALEHLLIPQLEETVKFITMKLDEMERSSRVRLLKIKEMFR